jgi:hypothetical protein
MVVDHAIPWLRDTGSALNNTPITAPPTDAHHRNNPATAAATTTASIIITCCCMCNAAALMLEEMQRQGAGTKPHIRCTRNTINKRDRGDMGHMVQHTGDADRPGATDSADGIGVRVRRS